jgi:hypothetical protein
MYSPFHVKPWQKPFILNHSEIIKKEQKAVYQMEVTMQQWRKMKKAGPFSGCLLLHAKKPHKIGQILLHGFGMHPRAEKGRRRWGSHNFGRETR